jgi:Cys-tRNA synthase (O-phospho-L-seryl-tRNA:Cys-tRNA synthase)
LARFVLGCPFSDFQGGFKGFNIQTILPILGSVKQKKWNWDTEILAKSYWAGLHIEEVPGILNKSNKRQSKVAVFHEIFIMANGLYEIWKDKKIK